MKTKEFISKMDDVAGATIISSRGIHIYNRDRELIGWVSVDDFGAVDTSYEDIDTMKNKNEIVNLLFEYALTPLDKREDELKFRVRFISQVIFISGEFNCCTYLNQDKDSKNIFLDTPNEIEEVQTIFTKSEYDKLQQYHDWLPKFDEKDPHFEFLKNKNEK